MSITRDITPIKYIKPLGIPQVPKQVPAQERIQVTVRVRHPDTCDTDDENGIIVECSGQDIGLKIDFHHEIKARFDNVI